MSNTTHDLSCLDDKQLNCILESIEHCINFNRTCGEYMLLIDPGEREEIEKYAEKLQELMEIKEVIQENITVS